MFTEVIPPLHDVIFNIKTYLRAFFGGSSYRINIFFIIYAFNESSMRVDLFYLELFLSR